MTVLKMIFENVDSGKTLTWTLKNANSSITKVQVVTAMNSAIDVITLDGADPDENKVDIKDAYFYTTQKIELA